MPNPSLSDQLVAVEAEGEVPDEIVKAIEDMMISAEDMGASYDAKGFPAPEREGIANEYLVALTNTILSRLTASETARKEALARAERVEKDLARTHGALPYISGQLRHAYAHLVNGRAADLKRFADGLLAPQIERLENLSHPEPVEGESHHGA